MSNFEFGLKLKYDGKEVDSGVAVSREQLAKIGSEGEKAGKKAAASLDQVGMSAKATSAALRGVPAQFTDIVTSLQGGQAPLTVLLQQGGQLKDMFGGTGNAAKALGGYVLGLVNPFTVAAAAGGALAYAYYQGAAEATAFNKTLILSGNVAATTSGQLQDLARQVATSTGATRGVVSETLNEIAASGKVSADMLGKVTQAAIDMERAGGAAASDTVKEFAELGKSPVEAVLKLNDKYHFLTASVYEQVKALQDQGRETDAARLAQTAYADAIEGRVPALVENLGYVERAWKGIWETGKGAWDAMLGVGREKSIAEQLEVAKARAAVMARLSADNASNGKGLTTAQINEKSGVTALQAEIDLQNRLNFKQAESNLLREIGLAKAVEASELRERYLTKEQQQAKEIALITASTLSTEEKKNALLMVREKYADKSKKVSETDSALIQRSEDAARNLKAVNEELKAIAKARQDYAKSVEAQLGPLKKEADSLEQQLENYGKTRSEIEATAVARLEEATALAALNGASDKALNFLKQELEQRKRIREASAGLEARRAADDAAKVAGKAAEDAAKASEKAWKDFYGDLERGLTDSLYRSFEAGKGFGETFIGSLKNLFKSTVLKIGVQGVMSMVGVGSSGSSLTGDASGGTSGSSLLSMGNNAYNAYNAWSGGSEGVASGLYNSFATSSIGAGLGLSTGLAGSLGVAGGAGTVMGGSAALAAAEATVAGATAMTSAGAAIGAAIPVIGGVLAIGSLLGGLFGKSGERFKRTTASQTGSFSAGKYTDTGEADYYKDGPDFGTATDKALARLNKKFSTSLGTLLESLGEDVDIQTDSRIRLRRTSGALATDFYAKINGVDIVQQQQYGKDGADLAGSMKQFFEDVMSKGIVQAINATNIDTAIKGLFADIESVDQTSAMLTNVVNLATYSEELNDVWGISIKQAAEVASMTSDSTDALIANVAAIAQFSAAQRSVGETLALTRADLISDFDALSNASFPQTLADYDAAMKAVDTTVAGSLETFAELLAMREQFAQFTAAVDGIKASVSSAVFSLRSSAEQTAINQKALANAAISAGIAVPRSASELVALADAIDYTTEAGINLALALPSLVEKFNTASAAADRYQATLLEDKRDRANAAQATLDDLKSSYENLQTEALNNARGTNGGSVGGLSFSGSEYDSVSNFITYLDDANAKLAEMAASPFAEELESYTEEIKALAKFVSDQTADALYAGRLKAGDVAGAIAAAISKNPLNYTDYMVSRQGLKPDRSDFATRGAFDAAFAKWDSLVFNAGAFNHALELAQVKAMVEIGNYNSANALNLQNISGGYSANSASSEFKYSIFKEISDQYGIGTQTALQNVLSKALDVAVQNNIRQNFTSTGPGVASVQAARTDYTNAIESKYINGQLMIGQGAIAYADGLTAINAALKIGRISAEDYSKGLAMLTDQFGDGAYNVNDARLGGGMAAENLARAGAESIQFYFGKLADNVAALGEAAKAASEPVSLVGESIGRMSSASSVFGQSASAVMDGFMGMIGAGQSVLADGSANSDQLLSARMMVETGSYGRDQAMIEGSDYRNATLVSAAASVVSQIMTTQSASEAAKKLAASGAFAGASGTQIRDASLLMDGLTAFNAPAMEATFNRLSNALATKKITEAQYVDIFALSVDTFRGIDEEAEAVKTAMQSLADAMGGFADKLLIDQQRTTLGAAQSLDEINRQYAVARDSATTGDREAVDKYQSIAMAMLDKKLYDDQAAYNDAFGKVYGDARNLEILGVTTLNSINGGGEIISELRNLNNSLSGRVEQLEKNLTTALAQIARNTARTSSGIEQINTVGIPV